MKHSSRNGSFCMVLEHFWSCAKSQLWKCALWLQPRTVFMTNVHPHCSSKGGGSLFYVPHSFCLWCFAGFCCCLRAWCLLDASIKFNDPRQRSSLVLPLLAPTSSYWLRIASPCSELFLLAPNCSYWLHIAPIGSDLLQLVLLTGSISLLIKRF